MKAGMDSRILWAGALVVVLCATAAASPLKSRYVFIADESTVILSGGFAGVHEEFAVEGQFVLLFDPTGGKAAFESVDANLVGDSPFLSDARDLNKLFNMTSLSGEAIDDRAIAFEGLTADGLESTVLLRLELTDGAARLTGRTIPPPDSADFFVLNIEANAIHVPRYAGGTGEPNDPFLIETAEHLNTLGADPDDYDKHFKLIADIDLSEYLYDRAIIAPDTDVATERFDGTPFAGVLDANGHAISNLTIEGGSHLGLFGQLDSDAEIRDLGIVGVNIVGRHSYVGGLGGFVFEGTVKRCYVTGSVSGDRSVGGLVGYSLLGNVTDSYARGSVSGDYSVGGLVGDMFGGAVNRCHAAGTISGDWNVGGLVGGNVSNLTDSYAEGTVSGGHYVGGLVGCNGWRDRGGEAPGTIANCYSSASVPILGDPKSTGGLVGRQPYGEVVASFWDVEVSGQAASAGGTGLTTAEMQTAATFLAAGWDFVGETENGTEDIWWILEGQDYPRLSFDPSHQPNQAKTYTKVWGEDGDLWQPEDGTLLDFSYAGYHEGRNDLPDWEIGVNVKDFGAKGDGIADDTQAFQNAIKACAPNKVVFIPSGTYKLTDWLGVKDMIGHWVRPNPKSYFALRGEGRDETVLLLAVGLQEIHPWDQTTGHGRPTTQWSWWGGFLWFQDSIEVGVEDLTIEGGGEQYGIHWGEEGYNGIAFRNVEHGWVRNVRFVNVDSGIFVRNSKYVTIENITFESTPERPSTSDFEDNKGMSGHHAIDFGHTSSYCVADKIVLKNQFHHELGVSNGANHCVYSNCRGPSLHFDFHTQQDDLPNNLFTEIDAGRGDLIWRNNFYGACTGAVLWNITGEQLSLPYERSWVDHPVRVEDLKTLLVGWPIDLPDLQEEGRPWFEDIAPEQIDPQNIYHAQRIRRFSLGDSASTGTVRPRIER